MRRSYYHNQRHDWNRGVYRGLIAALVKEMCMNQGQIQDFWKSH